MTPRYAGPSRLAVDDIEVEKLVRQFRQGTSYLMVRLTSYLVVLICLSEVVCSLLKANRRNVNNFPNCLLSDHDEGQPLKTIRAHPVSSWLLGKNSLSLGLIIKRTCRRTWYM